MKASKGKNNVYTVSPYNPKLNKFIEYTRKGVWKKINGKSN